MALSVELHKKFKGFQMDVAFEHDGGSLGILGGSGMGKSMTLKMIACLLYTSVSLIPDMQAFNETVLESVCGDILSGKKESLTLYLSLIHIFLRTIFQGRIM